MSSDASTDDTSIDATDDARDDATDDIVDATDDIVDATDDIVDATDAVAEVIACAHAYEQALVDGDGAAAAAHFADDGNISRFGPEGAQFGRTAVVALRTAYAPLDAPLWLDERARVLAPGVVVHLAILQRGEATVQRTQLWKHDGTTWRIHHAHVSRLPMVKAG